VSDDRISALADKYPQLLQLEYYQGRLLAWTAPTNLPHDPSDATTWQSNHHEDATLVPDPEMAADMAELLAELGPCSDPIVWHRPEQHEP
jgi:hypothetical protein